MKKNKVVITGLGVVGPHGVDASAFSKPTTSNTNIFTAWPDNIALPHEDAVVAQVGKFPSEKFFTDRQMRMMDRAMLLASTAAGLAIEDAGLTPEVQKSACTFLGTARAELPSCYQFIRPHLGGQRDQLNAADFPKIARNVACGQLAIRYGLQGPSTVLASGALASLEAAVRAAQYIRSGRAEVALVGGYEALSRFSLFFFAHHYRNHLLAKNPSYFSNSPGFLIPSEGACMLVLESAESAERRGSPVYCSIDSWYSGRFGNEQEPVLSLQTAWSFVQQDRQVGLFSAASGGSNREFEQIETDALSTGISDLGRPYVVAPRAWVGEGEAWGGALQLAVSAAALRSRQIRGVHPVWEDRTPAQSEACTHLRPLQATTALVNGLAAGGHFTQLFLTAS